METERDRELFQRALTREVRGDILTMSGTFLRDGAQTLTKRGKKKEKKKKRAGTNTRLLPAEEVDRACATLGDTYCYYSARRNTAIK